MHTTDWIDLIAELLPRPVRQLLVVLLAVGLMTGTTTAAFQWYVTTKAHELVADLTPAFEELVTPARPSAP